MVLICLHPSRPPISTLLVRLNKLTSRQNCWSGGTSVNLAELKECLRPMCQASLFYPDRILEWKDPQNHVQVSGDHQLVSSWDLEEHWHTIFTYARTYSITEKKPDPSRYGPECILPHNSTHQMLNDDHESHHTDEETDDPQKDVLSRLIFLVSLL